MNHLLFQSPKICIGVMSKKCVDTIIDFCNEYKMPCAFIPSRRQIEFNGGYVNGWTTDEFCKYVRDRSESIILERDHGGCGQGLYDDDGIESLKIDCKQGNFDVIHIDPWVKYKDLQEGINETIKLILICYEINSNIYFEVGTEERIRYFTSEETDILIRELQSRLPKEIYERIIYVVIQCGTHLHENINIGTYDKNRLTEMVSVCKKYKKLSKEHNGDYIPIDIIREKLQLGIDSINIAPEFGQIETRVIMDILSTYPDLYNRFYDICYTSGKWKKWVDETFDPIKNKETLMLVCGHYVFSNRDFITLISSLSDAIKEKVHIALWSKLDELRSLYDMWNVFDKNTEYLLNNDIDNFRRNGLSHGIEIGLLYSDRINIINQRTINIENPELLIPKHYNSAYSETLKRRKDNLINIIPEDFIIKYSDYRVGNPQCSLDGLNTNELYTIYDCWQILHTLKYLNNCKKQLNILEIGGGFGSLGCKLMKNLSDKYDNINYYTVDLPEVLKLQKYYFEKHNLINNPKISISYLSNMMDTMMETMMDNNKTITYDIVIQCRGFSEMNEQSLNNYFKLIQKNISKNGLFYLGCQRYVAYRGHKTMRIRDYPFDNNWGILKSQPSWLATHGHDMALIRIENPIIPFKEVLKSFPIVTPPPGPLTIDYNVEKWTSNNRVPNKDLF